MPTDFHVVQHLCKLVKAREEAGGAAPTLAVVAIGGFRALDARLSLHNRTA